MPRLELMSVGEIEIKHNASLRHKAAINNPNNSQEDFDKDLEAFKCLSKDLGEVTLIGFAEMVDTPQSFLKLALAR